MEPASRLYVGKNLMEGEEIKKEGKFCQSTKFGVLPSKNLYKMRYIDNRQNSFVRLTSL